MAVIENAFELGSVVGLTNAEVGHIGETAFSLGTVVGTTDPAVEETGNGISFHRLGSVYATEMTSVTQP